MRCIRDKKGRFAKHVFKVTKYDKWDCVEEKTCLRCGTVIYIPHIIRLAEKSSLPVANLESVLNEYNPILEGMA